MKTSLKRRTVIAKKPLFPKLTSIKLERLIHRSLDSHKAEDVVSVDLAGKADFADCMVIASGTSSRHVSSLAQHVMETLKQIGLNKVAVEGLDTGDWVLVDAGDVIVHIFKPEARKYYNLEKMWSVATPQVEAVH